MPLSDRGDKQKFVEQPRSYLDEAVHTLVDPAANAVFSTKRAQVVSDEVSFYARGLAKTAPLLMKGELAVGATILAYAADQAKIGTSLNHQLEDAGLGAAKALTMKGSFAIMEKRGFSPTASGIGLGISSRTLETALTRESYYGGDAKDQFSFLNGMQNTVKSALNPGSLAVDALTFGAADIAWGRMYMTSRGAIRFNPVVERSIMAGTMGVSTGAGGELNRQVQSGEDLDFSKILQRGVAQGGINILAGGLAGMQANRAMRLNVRDEQGSLQAARATPFQKGELIDEAQRALKEGEFTPTKSVDGLTTQTIIGIVKHDGHEIPALFRPDNGTEGFAARQQAELVGYGLSKKMNADTSPVTVARTLEVGGHKISGFIQEMRGTNMFDSLLPNARMAPLMHIGHSQRAAFGSDTAMQSAFEKAYVQRMIMGEWDNHSLNFSVEKLPDAGPRINNLDFGDALRPAANTSEFLPSPGLRTSYEPLARNLYQQMAGKPLSQETVDGLQQFLRYYDNPAGQAELKALGMTDQQLLGVMGRSRWFAQNRYLPRDAEPTTYHYFKQFIQFLRGRSGHQPTTIKPESFFSD